ncbi:MAG: LptF/LptG family permease [Balneolales bacterium]
MRLLPNHIQADLLKRHIGPFIFCFLTIMFLLMMQFFIQFIDHLVGKNIPAMVIIELITVNLAYMVVLAVPMTILAATLMAFGKFSEQNEFTAVKAAGIHPMRIITPVMGVALILSLFLIWFSNYALPEANYKARALFLDIRMKKPGFDLQDNVFYNGIDGYTFLVQEVSSVTDSLYGVTVFQDAKDDRDRVVIKADKGHLSGDESMAMLTLDLFQGSSVRYLPQSSARKDIIEETLFDTYRIRFDLSDLSFSRTNPEQRRRDGRTMRAQAMLAAVDSLQDDMVEEKLNFNSAAKSLRIRDPVHETSSLSSNEYSGYDNYDNSSGAGRILDYMDEADLNEPIESPYTALSVLGTLEEQKEISRSAVGNFRNTFTQYDNLQNNLLWRVERIASFMVEVHKKVSLPVACFIFVLVGAPLGLLTKKGNLGVNALISTLLFTYYWICIIQGEKLADRLFVSPFIGMWFANATMLIAGIILMIKVIRENRF